nr:D-alanyl-D-alanine endopeptidase [Paraburkholderia busanensis]
MSHGLQVLIQAVGWALLHFVWEGALIGAATLLLSQLLRNARAQHRYALYCVAMSLCFLLPVLHVWREMSIPLAPPASLASDFDSQLAFGVASARATPNPLSLPLPHLMPWLVGGWFLGVAAMLSRIAAGLVWIHRRGAREQSWADSHWQTRVAALAASWGIRRAISLRIAAGFHGPMTVGWWRPMIVIPAALLTQMPPALIEALLAHEIAHIKRFDYLVNLLQSVIEALLFFHPVVWWLSRQVRIERERIADDLAASQLGEPRRLALALEQLSRLQPCETSESPIGQWAAGAGLLDRIRRLVRPVRRPLDWRGVVAASAFGAALIGMVIHAPGLAQMDARADRQPLATALTALNQTFADTVKAPNKAMLADAMRSHHVAVLDDDSGQVLLQKNADAVVPIASLTKLMTAMVVLDGKPDMNGAVRIGNANDDTLRPIRSGLPAGASLPLRVVMQLALMSSDNGAAYALAKNYPGGLPAFNAAVRAKIAALGLSHTTLGEPTGLSPENRSTARELAVLANAAAQYPDIARYTTNAADDVRIDGRTVRYRNTNPFVGTQGWEDIALSKTGFTAEAGRCLIMRVRTAGKNVTMVLLDANDAASSTHDAVNIRRVLLTGLPLHQS